MVESVLNEITYPPSGGPCGHSLEKGRKNIEFTLIDV
jgi:hypothetical protein